jgi:glycosyltransferase involved in cell wall biosynthesis
MKRKILLVTELCPWPVRGGQYIRVNNLIDAITRRYEMAVLAPQPASCWPLKDRIDQWFDCGPLVAKTQIFQYKLRTHPAFRKLLEKALRNFQPDITWFDYRYWGQYVPIARKLNARCIMGTHNIQYRIKQQYGRTLKNPLYRFLNFLSYQFEYLHERLYFANFDSIVTVSREEYEYYNRRFRSQEIFYIPNFINENHYSPAPVGNSSRTILITASFDSYQNQEGLRWFLFKVWPQIQSAMPASRLRLAGFGASRFISQLERSFTSIHAVDGFDKFSDVMEDVALAAVPILHGAGSRLKILEALASQVPIVSTSRGAEGIALRSKQEAIIADSATAFSAAIIDLLQHPKQRESLAQAGYKLLKANFGFEINQKRLDRLINQVLNIS